MKNSVIVILLIIATISLPTALFNPIAIYSVADKERIDQLIGGPEKLKELYSDLADTLKLQMEENDEEIAEFIIEKIDTMGWCKARLCTALRNNQVFEKLISNHSGSLLETFNTDSIDKFYEPLAGWAYTSFRDSKYGEEKKSNILQLISILWGDKQYFLTILVGVFAVLFPILKLITSYGGYVRKNHPLIENLYNIASKLSFVEIFVLAILITSFQSIPFLKLDVGVTALSAYVIFTITLIFVDLLRGRKSG